MLEFETKTEFFSPNVAHFRLKMSIIVPHSDVETGCRCFCQTSACDVVVVVFCQKSACTENYPALWHHSTFASAIFSSFCKHFWLSFLFFFQKMHKNWQTTKFFTENQFSLRIEDIVSKFNVWLRSLRKRHGITHLETQVSDSIMQNFQASWCSMMRLFGKIERIWHENNFLDPSHAIYKC